MEHEVHDHVKKATKTWRDPSSSLMHKVREIALEVAIIVFAVSISIWFHNMSEKRHQRHEAEEFLLGLREDLTQDIGEMKSDQHSYEEQGTAFQYVLGLKMKQVADKDTLRKYYAAILGTAFLVPNDGRFEGFKSSGKIGTIEDKTLQNDIMGLYQEDIPSLLINTNDYVSTKRELITYLQQNKKRVTDTTSNYVTLVNTDGFRNYAQWLANPKEILRRYEACIQKMNTIIAAIDKEYGKQKEKKEH